MRKPVYTQGVCEDGAAILKDGVMMTVDEIVAELNSAHITDQGYVRVPVEPTAEMIRKGQGQWSGESMVEIYKAMLAAATQETSHD